ncbi:MAG TPA: hypothetical protein VFU56_05245 [Gaiellaceae bacterium]|nr:hypothetical protein [Gaiellaceae bacterium]
MNAFTGRATPDPLFYRGLGFGLLGAGAIWLALGVLLAYVV